MKHITGDYRRQVMIIKKLEKTRQQIFHITKPFFILTNAACKNTDIFSLAAKFLQPKIFIMRHERWKLKLERLETTKM